MKRTPSGWRRGCRRVATSRFPKPATRCRATIRKTSPLHCVIFSIDRHGRRWPEVVRPSMPSCPGEVSGEDMSSRNKSGHGDEVVRATGGHLITCNKDSGTVLRRIGNDADTVEFTGSFWTSLYPLIVPGRYQAYFILSFYVK